MNEQQLEKLVAWIEDAKSICFFGGAGVSTESGVPDFRSKDGLYNQHDVQFDMYRPEYLLSHTCLVREPKVYYEYHRQKMDTRDIQPNMAHKYLTYLEKTGKLDCIVTQNIDGLHQKAGSKKVYEIHGSALRNYCSSCGKKYPESYIFDSKEPVPHCECDGVIRPDIVLYEEGLPQEAVDASIRSIASSDMLIVGGTSLTVYPAASFINYFHGRYLVVINRDPLNIQSSSETLFITESIGEVFARVAEKQGVVIS